MTCEETLRGLDEDAALGAREGVAAHRLVCAGCDQAYREEEILKEALRSLPLPELGKSYWTGYRDRLRRRVDRRRPRRPWLPFAAAAAAALVAFPLLRGGARDPSGPPELAVAPSAPAPSAPRTREPLAPSFEAYLNAEDSAARADLEARLERLARTQWPELVSRIASPEAGTVHAALAVLERLRLPETVPAIAARLDGTAWRDEAVLRTVARLDLPASSRVLRDGLENPDRQSQAMSALEEFPSRRAVPLLLTCYLKLPPDLRDRAREILLADAALTGRLLRERLGLFDDPTLAGLAPLIAQLGLQEAAPHLLRLASTREHARAALEALAGIDCPSVLRHLAELPTHQILIYLRARGPEAGSELRRLALDRSPRLVHTALLLLPEFVDPQNLNILRSLLARAETHLGAIETLGRLGGNEAAKLLVDAYPTSPSKAEIVTALGRLRVADGLVPLLHLAEDRHVSIVPLSTALGAYPREQVVPTLISGLQSPSSRPRAYELLRRLTGEKIPASAPAWERWWKTQSQG